MSTAHPAPYGARREETYAEKLGGFRLGAAFFGWLVAFALTILLGSVLAAIATAAGTSLDVGQSEVQREAQAAGLTTAIALLVVLAIAYFAGGYVAGRMSRFDGGRQGVGVWLLGVLVTLVAAAVGGIFGAQYDIFQRAQLPSIPVPTGALTIGVAISVVVLLAVTLVAAILGGKAGQRFHTKVDRTIGDAG